MSVLWVSWHDDILARGYADEGLLEAILDRSLWTPPNALTYTHIEVRGDFPAVEGAVVVLPARHHVDDVERFCAELDTLRWSVVILAGDEAWEFPWERITERPNRRVWTMQPVPAQAQLSGLIPGGWYPGTREAISIAAERAGARPLDWFFAGQVTHLRREQCAEVLRTLPSGLLHESDGYMRGMPRRDYFAQLAGAKVIPCPSGPCTVDTARPLEALEAGCVPVVDTLRPADVGGRPCGTLPAEPYDYWGLLFGEHPLTTISDWASLPDLVAHECADWPHNANRAWAWWQGWKRRIALQLDHDVREVGGCPAPLQPGPADLITVIITTSPIPSHPGTAVIDETVASVRDQLPTAEIVIAIDGVRPEQVHRAGDYAEYVRRLLWRTNFDWHNVVPLLMPHWVHQANATRAALELVNTPLVLFVEHDTPLVGDIDWPGLCAFVQSTRAHVVRLHHETEILPVHRGVMLDHSTRHVGIGGHVVPARRTSAWWQRPHLASTAFYRDKVMSYFTEASRSMIEDAIYGRMHCDVMDRGDAGWQDWRVWIYTPDGNMKRSAHLDGRGAEEKYPMWV